MKLYEISQQYQGLMAMSEDLPEEVLFDTLEAITDELDTKAEAIIHVIANMDVTPIDTEIKRLQRMKKTIVNRKAGLKDYLRHNMQACDISKIEWPTGAVTLKKPTKVVNIYNASDVPDRYMKITYTPDKAGIKMALARGDVVSGCSLVDGTPGLLIR